MITLFSALLLTACTMPMVQPPVDTITTPNATAAITTAETITTTMPNLAGYPHLAASEKFFEEKVVPTIVFGADLNAFFCWAGQSHTDQFHCGRCRL